MMTEHGNLIERTARHARRRPEHPAYIFLRDGEQEHERIGYGALMRRVEDLAAQLRRAGAAGGRALLVYPQGIDFVVAFLACLAARVVAVPLPLPHAHQHEHEHEHEHERSGRDGRFSAIARDARADWVLCLARHGALLRPRVGDAVIVATDQAPLPPSLSSTSATLSVPPLLGGARPDPDAPAFLQYTSGVTGLPKGVMVTHRNLAHNLHMMTRALGADEHTVCVSWIPSYRDMGLVGAILGTLYVGGTCVLMPPQAFMQKPVRWLRAIAAYRASISGAPNFAYDLCVRRIGAADLAGLDLSHWRRAFCGAEPVRAETLERFGARCAAAGFDAGAFYPCYGMAEATLFVAGPAGGTGLQAGRYDLMALAGGQVRRAGPHTPPGQVVRLPGCGLPWGQQEVHIVDPDLGQACASHEVGEIWLCGDSVAGGYWAHPEATRAVFHATLPGRARQRFLRTGDLGFIDGGHLYIAGRMGWRGRA